MFLGIAPVADIDRQLPFEYTITSRSTDVVVELKSIFEKQAGVEWFDQIQTFHACKQDEGKPVDSCCNSYLGKDLRMNDSHNEPKFENGKDAYKVLDVMSMNKFVKKYGTVKAYFDSFNSLFSERGFEEWYLVDLFICGLPLDIEKGVSMFKPKTLSDACCLAKLQESTHNFMVKNSNRPLFYSSKFNDSKEGVENNVGLRDLDVSWKDGFECEEIELRIQVNSNCLIVLDNSKGDQSRERESTSFSSFHLTGSHKFVNHVGERSDLVTEIVSKGDTSVVLTIKFEKTKASIQVTQEDKEDDMVMEDETIMCLVDLGYGSDGLKVNSSVNGVLDSRIMNEFDVVMNSSKGD
ncbi:hypothetical protein Tco_0038355 [Tanacetum coccineum]